MASVTLAVGTLLLVIPSYLLYHVGGLFAHRARHADEPFMLRVFSTFWYSGAAVVGSIALHPALTLAGIDDLAVHVALNFARTVPLALALWALLFYLLFLYTGRRSLGVPLGVLYAGYLAFLVWYQAGRAPFRLASTDWDVRLAALHPPGDALATAYALLFGGPIVLATLAYGSLYFGVRDRTVRYRIATVTLSFLVLFGAIVSSLLLRLEDETWFPLSYEIPIVVACLGIVAAYRPPAWIRRRWDIRPMEVAA